MAEPIGSQRIYRLPEAAKTYEQIVSIEFLERADKNHNIRSAAYRPVNGGAQTRIRTGIQDELVDEDMTEEEARVYIDALVDAGIFDWKYSYRPVQGTFINVVAQWHLKIEFADKSYKTFIAEGENYFPDNYDEVTDILVKQS